MPDFTFQPPAAISPGFLAVAPPAAGSTTRPAQPGSLLFDHADQYDLLVTSGMLPMRIEVYGAGAAGGVVSKGTMAAGGGGGAGYAAGTFGDGLITPGSHLTINVAAGGTSKGDAGLRYGSSSYVNAGAASLAVAVGGNGSTTMFGPARGGGGTHSPYLCFCSAGAVNVVLATGDDGQAGTPTDSGAGGDAGGPEGGAGGAGGASHHGNPGLDPGGGGSGAKFVGSDKGVVGADGWVRISWPADT